MPDRSDTVNSPDRLFLTDGKSKIRYGDLARMHRLLKPELSSFAREKQAVGIDTNDRFRSALWMALCWMQYVPFVPFHPDQSTSGARWRPPVFIDQIARLPLPDDRPEDRSNPEFIRESLLHPQDHRADAVFCTLHTSGSSGEPRKIPLLRRQMIAAAQNAVHAGQLQPDEATLWGNCLPLYHAGGMTIVFRALLTGTGVFLWDRFDVKTVGRDLSDNADIRQISLVPTMLKRLLDHDSRHSLQCALVGGGPAPSGLIQSAREHSWPAVFSYGMTETCGQIAAQRIDGSSPPDSVGHPFPGHVVSIRDDRGREVPTGNTGTIWISGPQVFTDHHFNTGDFGHFDEQGNLYIEARRTDLVVSGGVNIRPAEIEEVLMGCPLIADAGVTGIPDEEWGQRLVALVVPAENTKTGLSDDEIDSGQHQHQEKSTTVTSRSDLFTTDRRLKDLPSTGISQTDPPSTDLPKMIGEYLAERLHSFRLPKNILLVDSLPRTSLGKIRREELRALAIARLAEK